MILRLDEGCGKDHRFVLGGAGLEEFGIIKMMLETRRGRERPGVCTRSYYRYLPTRPKPFEGEVRTVELWMMGSTVTNGRVWSAWVLPGLTAHCHGALS